MREAATPTTRHLFLAGWPPIHEFVRFMKLRSVDGLTLDEIALTRDWQQAAARVHQLAGDDGNAAEINELNPLDTDLADAAQRALNAPAVQKSLGFLPHSWAMVDLSRLMVWQKTVDVSFANRLKEALPPRPSPDQLLRVATGDFQTDLPVQTRGIGSNNFVFASTSTDLRVLGVAPLQPDAVQGYQPFGRAVAVLGIFVGYSINVMMAVRVRNRLMLTNGTHRAYALSSLGITHAPCVVVNASAPEDLDLLGLSGGRSAVEACFGLRRPPMLKDFFDERLARVLLIARETCLLQAELKFTELRAPIG